MTNHLINTTVTWLKYNGKIISSDLLEDNKLQIIRKTKIPIKEYKKIYKEVGYKYNWIGRLKIKEAELKEIIHSSLVDIYLMKKNNKTIGFLEMDYRSSKEIKIVHLGLIESYIGKGYGKKTVKICYKKSQ